MNSTGNSEIMSPQPLIIAVDGHSSCGKSTFARLIAKELNFVYIDSGAMYRAVALYAIEHNMIPAEHVLQDKLNKSLQLIHITFKLNQNTGLQETWLNGKNVEPAIRGIEVSNIVSKISQIAEVRSEMVRLQRNIGTKGNVVMDGRDIGSTVFPGATLKIFMTADTIVRAKRRFKELVEKGINVDFQEVVENIKMRDHEDETRMVSPLRKAPDALVLDNSNMTIDQQMVWFRNKWKEKSAAHEN
jgi:cytidylate kinase